MTKKSAQEMIADPPKNILYVVLHGLICLIDDKKNNRFWGYLIDNDEHRFLCGNFGKEDDIDDDEALELVNVDPNNETANNVLNPAKNAVVQKARLNYGDEQSVIKLPRPENILYYIRGAIQSGSLQDPGHELVPGMAEICGIRVFRYSFKDYNTVKLLRKNGKPFWDCPKPKPTPKGDEAVAVLHVYNEPPEDLGSGAARHNLDEFEDTLTYMQAKQILLKAPAKIKIKNDPPPAGVKPEELVSLDVRPLSASQTDLSFDEKRALQLGKYPTGGAGGTQVCGGANGILG